MRKLTRILLIGIIVSCSESSEHKGTAPDINHYDNVDKVEIFGDSLRIEYEISGNTIIKHYIDLKGTDDNGFDNSYTVTSEWSAREIQNLTCEPELRFIWDSLDFRFCLTQVVQEYQDLVSEAGPWRGDSGDSSNLFNQKIVQLQKVKKELEDLKGKRIGELETYSIYMPFELIESLDFNVTDMRTDTALSKILVEKYNTEFSGGKNYYFVNHENDTIGSLHKNEYMR